ncbi:MAG TPA: hypothetical protein VF598_14165 [Hymenobacter sp.]|jgi:hypothetical protein
MTKLLRFLVLLFIPTASVFGQADFRPGYIVLLTGDTLRGQIKTASTQHNLRQCAFRATDNAPSVEYTPKQLKGYGLPNDKQHYLSAVIAISDTSQAAYFLEVLVRGSVTLLYASNNGHDPRFFLQKTTGSREELKLIKRTVDLGGRTYVQEIRQYQQVLLTSFADCPALASAIKQARFGENSLAQIVERYNTCIGSTAISNTTATRGIKAQFGVLAGAALIGNMRINSASGLGYYNAKLSDKLTPIAGLQLGLNNARLNRRLWFYLSAYYQQRSYKGQAAVGAEATSSVDQHYDLAYKASFIRLPLTLRYVALTGTVRPFAELGIGTSLRLRESKNEYVINYSNGLPPTRRILFDGSRTYEQGLVAGAGLTINRAQGHNVNILLRYELSNGISPYTTVASGCASYYVLLSYNLTK